MIRTLTLGLIALGSLVAFVPSASAYTYCDGVLYDPLTGDELVTQCYDYYSYSNGCYSYEYYIDRPVYVEYSEYEYCYSGGSCYAGLLFVDLNSVRAGLC